MKRIIVILLVFTCMLIFAGCNRKQIDNISTQDEQINSFTIAMEKIDIETPAPTESNHHQPKDTDNIVLHEIMGYCGNTVTTVSCIKNDDPWENSFWGSDSVTLTDLLLYLDYKDEVCRCNIEYIVDTEFGKNYGINLSEGFVRYDESQCDLTDEQISNIQDIIDDNRYSTDK